MKSILIVDDEQSFVLALELALKAEGFNIITAANGEEALMKFKDVQPHLVLLDIMMPGMGGLETLKKIRSLPKQKDVPVLLMSGARPFVRQSEYHWDAFLYKPFELDELLSALNRALDK